VLPLLQDEAAQVRFLAAAALLPAREPAAVPALIRLLADGPPDLGWRAEELLFRLAGESGPTVWLDAASDNQGNKVRTAWESWWKNNAAKIDWHKLQLGEQALGLTLVVENQRDGGGRIYECTPAGTIRWQVPILNPIDAQWLPGGRLLVGDSRASLIYEMDTRGAITWKHAGIAPTSCQRLPNGNTVVSTYQCILELTREGKTIFTHSTQGHTYHARKLPDGHYIWIDACGEVGMIDDRGKEIAKIKIGNGLTWGSVERLPNGRFLIALGGVNRIQEIDLAGKVYWEKAINNPNRAARLANGNILVASHGDQCIYELDPHGKQLWKHDCAGRPFAAARR
jgi:outer membrane protein assembly factor BamB